MITESLSTRRKWKFDLIIFGETPDLGQEQNSLLQAADQSVLVLSLLLLLQGFGAKLGRLGLQLHATLLQRANAARERKGREKRT